MIKRLLIGAGAGTFVGLSLLIVGLVRSVAAGISPFALDLDLVVIYVSGFAAAGACLGAAWKLRRFTFGNYILGIFGAFVAIGAVVFLVDGHPATWGPEALSGWIVISVLTGIVAGFFLANYWDAAA